MQQSQRHTGELLDACRMQMRQTVPTGVLLGDARTWQTVSVLVVLVRLRSVDHGVDNS